ncbi:hypothetical protein, partial [Lactiplantibacillus plantarum]|uniref:hypothetical protein n=1 Tax=Lactiplantibacillus plantarum TaxID=1590 RepID=UPI003C1E3387
MVPLQAFIDIRLPERSQRRKPLDEHLIAQLHDVLAYRCIYLEESIGDRKRFRHNSFWGKDSQIVRLMAMCKMRLHLQEHRRRYLARDLAECQH